MAQCYLLTVSWSCYCICKVWVKWNHERHAFFFRNSSGWRRSVANQLGVGWLRSSAKYEFRNAKTKPKLLESGWRGAFRNKLWQNKAARCPNKSSLVNGRCHFQVIITSTLSDYKAENIIWCFSCWEPFDQENGWHCSITTSGLLNRQVQQPRPLFNATRTSDHTKKHCKKSQYHRSGKI